MLGAFFKDMKSSFTLLIVLTAATAFFVVQPVKAGHVVQGGPTFVSVPDGGSTVSLLGFALLGVAALRRKLSRYVVFENLRFGADPGSGRPVSVATLP
jgi:VPDSG-CTERM motif